MNDPDPSESAPPPSGVLRMLDAAANRAAEGLRVVEDYTRFVLDDAHLTGAFKELRHELAAVLAGVPGFEEGRFSARDTLRDVGTVVIVRSIALTLSC